MRYLLDTHVFIWWTHQPEKLSPRARALFEDPATALYLSIGSMWEMATKHSIGSLKLEPSISAFLKIHLGLNRIVELPISMMHAVGVNDLPFRHRDTFDRLLVAQALHEGMTLVSHNSNIHSYDVPVVW